MDLGGMKEVGPGRWEIARHGDMVVPAHIFASRALIQDMDDKVREQLCNVACLPGIVRAGLAMPDAHWGYGFPIGGVAAFDPDRGGVISVGGVGYDISCGVRTMRTGLVREDVAVRQTELADALFQGVPVGLGSQGRVRTDEEVLDQVLTRGAVWAVQQGYGTREDLPYIEEQGRLVGADPGKVSATAKKRQLHQVGTLGSGNHYLEVQWVDTVYDTPTAEAYGIREDDVVVSLHCGSRALGHQIGTDYLQELGRAARRYKIPIKERELVCAPIDSPEGRDYYSAMACGVNCALANRQVLGHLVREVFARFYPRAELGLLYDVSHNTCKIEEHDVDGRTRRLYVHRKGATRALGPGNKHLPERYEGVGQPVLIGGSMGTASYILAGDDRGEGKAWGSACHGAGRAMSRKQATKRWKGKGVLEDLARQGIAIRAASMRGVAEEAPLAYKDVGAVVAATQEAGLARKVARLRPMICVKG